MAKNELAKALEKQMMMGRMKEVEMNGMAGVFGFGYIDDEEILGDAEFQNAGMKSANVGLSVRDAAKKSDAQNVLAPNEQQRQTARRLAEQFASQKGGGFTEAQIQVIERKILEKISIALKDKMSGRGRG